MQLLKGFNLTQIEQIEQLQTVEKVQEYFKQNGATLEAVRAFLIQLYQFATLSQYNMQQKEKVLNLAIRAFEILSKSPTKQNFIDQLRSQVESLGKRDQKNIASFSTIQTTNLFQFFRERLITFYELYSVVIDTNPHFELSATPLDLIRTEKQFSLKQGNVTDVENIGVLKQFLGIRAPKDQKKDVKKK